MVPRPQGRRTSRTRVMFEDRAEAGRRLAAALAGYKDEQPVVLGLPRGGVAVAAEIAEALDAPLGLILVRKIGAPTRRELALGAVVDGQDPCVVRNDDVIQALGVDDATFDAICRRELGEIERRRRRYAGDATRVDVAGRMAIVVDDGIATGATMRAALRATRMRRPKKLVLAVPVAAPEALDELRSEVDDLVCLISEEPLSAIGLFYVDFHQMSDAEVTEILARFAS
jgi:putative phosphoribosyl transferase